MIRTPLITTTTRSRHFKNTYFVFVVVVVRSVSTAPDLFVETTIIIIPSLTRNTRDNPYIYIYFGVSVWALAYVLCVVCTIPSHHPPLPHSPDTHTPFIWKPVCACVCVKRIRSQNSDSSTAAPFTFWLPNSYHHQQQQQQSGSHKIFHRNSRVLAVSVV